MQLETLPPGFHLPQVFQQGIEVLAFLLWSRFRVNFIALGKGFQLTIEQRSEGRKRGSQLLDPGKGDPDLARGKREGLG